MEHYYECKQTGERVLALEHQGYENQARMFANFCYKRTTGKEGRSYMGIYDCPEGSNAVNKHWKKFRNGLPSWRTLWHGTQATDGYHHGGDSMICECELTAEETESGRAETWGLIYDSREAVAPKGAGVPTAPHSGDATPFNLQAALGWAKAQAPQGKIARLESELCRDQRGRLVPENERKSLDAWGVVANWLAESGVPINGKAAKSEARDGFYGALAAAPKRHAAQGTLQSAEMERRRAALAKAQGK